MLSETKRPEIFSDIIGHDDAKKILETYLKSDFKGAIFLNGSPGIGKTTLALCAAKTFEFDAMEINASKMLRSFDDVEVLRNSCLSSVNIQSFVRGDYHKKTCLILDEIDGSDPHAQVKIVDWIKSDTRKVPLILTGNEIPVIFKKNSEFVQIIRCFPPNIENIKTKFPDVENIDSMIVECKHDIRRLIHRIQYGSSYSIPLYPLPPTGSPYEMIFLWKQKMFGMQDPLECLYDIPDISHSHRTMFECNFDEKHDGRRVSAHRQKKYHPDI
jgi:hypothetical protein